MFPYRKILNQAWQVTQKHKFLWAFGLLLFLGQVGNAAYVVVSQNERLWTAVQDFFKAEWLIWAAFIVVCLWLLVYFRARAGIILTIKSLFDHEPARPLLSFSTGRFFVTRLLGLMILLQLVSLIISLIITTPVFYLFAHGMLIRGLILAILGMGVALPFVFLVLYLDILGALFIVIYNMPLRAALTGAVNLIASFWRRLLVLGLYVLGLRIMILALAALLASPFVILARMGYHRGGSLLSLVLLMISGSIIFLAVGSIFMAFEQAVWVRMFGELVKPQKMQDKEEAEVVPETAGG